MRVLFLCHNHPGLQAGGTEVFARGLFRALHHRRWAPEIAALMARQARAERR